MLEILEADAFGDNDLHIFYQALLDGVNFDITINYNEIMELLPEEIKNFINKLHVINGLWYLLDRKLYIVICETFYGKSYMLIYYSGILFELFEGRFKLLSGIVGDIDEQITMMKLRYA